VKSLFAGLLFLLTILPAFCQQVPNSGMPTLETAFFSKLEKRLGDAVVAHDRAALESLLGNDFELRTTRTGGELTLRDDWLEAATTTYRIRSYGINRLTVRQFGEAAVVSFFCEQQATFQGKDIIGDFFIVDVWQRAGSDWKIAARYSSGPGIIPKSLANPKTKE
jgi:hypothetical protein